MKKYTQQEFDNFEIVDGVKQCPSGDYTDIKIFGERCSFGEWCSFGKWCSFGVNCSFGEWCIFGVNCSFGEWCSFGVNCSFGKSCSFGERCSYRNIVIQNKKVVSIFGIGESETIYRWLSVDDINYYQVGCFFGKESEFRDAVNDKYDKNHIYHHAIDFINKIEVA